jgi:hypothetical protein
VRRLASSHPGTRADTATSFASSEIAVLDPNTPPAEGVASAVDRRNCWSCQKHFRIGGTHGCRSLAADPEPVATVVADWLRAHDSLHAAVMPPRDSDGCPGWTAGEPSAAGGGE